MSGVQILTGDALSVLRTLPSESVHCCVTSPPYYGLRDYGNADQIGMESDPEAYISRLVDVFREVRRVLHRSGTLWAVMGDSFAGSGKGRMADGTHSPEHGSKQGTNTGTLLGTFGQTRATNGLKPKDLIGIPWMLAFALRADGWYLRSDIIWAKGNPMPESVRDRPTKSHEYVFLLSKERTYFFDSEAVAEPAVSTHGSGKAVARPQQLSRGGRGKEEQWEPTPTRKIRTAWHINTQPYDGAHFAVFPERLAEIPILAGTSSHGCCAECLSPWKRVVEKDRSFESGSGRSGVNPVGKNGSGLQGGGETMDIRRGPVVTTRTLDWIPTCKCGTQEAAPCVVLDPFAGSGTTGAVAAKHGRNAILIELNPDYVAFIEKRVHGVQRVFPMEMVG